MRILKHSAVLAVFAMAALAPLPAGAQSSTIKNVAVEKSNVTTVAYRGDRQGFRGYRGGDGYRQGYRHNRGIGTGAIIGGSHASTKAAIPCLRPKSRRA